MRPGLVPAVIADGVAQGQQRIDVGPGAVHARALHPRFDHQVVGTLYRPAANGPACRLEGGILQLAQAR